MLDLQWPCRSKFKSNTRLCLLFHVANPNQSGYAVRMESTIPMVNQAPPIQPLQMRPGVMAQVRLAHIGDICLQGSDATLYLVEVLDSC